ncbi:class I SAM-dependent methyltransferase [Streptomyces pseudogriseolus]|uniref:class I SAM-dependent methyltransferase n=1 Tax=Streptomyces pseudogriseolus TaxID=36817 RepID=UPI003FA2E31F
MFSHQDEQEWLRREREIDRAVHDGFGTVDRPGSWTEESPFALCQYFLLRLGGRTWLGRKLVPEGRTDPSSVLTPRMLMGEFDGMRFTRQKVVFYFTPRPAAEHAAVLARAAKDHEADIDFPFPRLDSDWNEALVPAHVWDGSAELADNLDPDEAHFRAAAAVVLRDVVRPGDTVYDPACSTGRFVSSLGEVFPECRIMASDASAAMVDLARRRIPDAFVADGLGTPVAEESVQVLVIRFLNAEVLSADTAVAGFRSLVRLIAPGGHALVFGHTPVLPAVRHLAAECGLEVRSAVAARPGTEDEVFQFYLLRRPADAASTPSAPAHA